MRHMKHRLLTVTVATAMAMALTVPYALANHESSPKSGPDHARGEDVAYPLVFPVQGANTFGDHFWSPRGRGIHHAVDIMANKMTPIVAVASGTVQWVGSNCCTLRIKHDDGWSSSYIHLNNDSPGTDDGQGWGIAPGITKGTHVNAGQLIAYVGDSGNAEGTSRQRRGNLASSPLRVDRSTRRLRRPVPLAAGGRRWCSGDRFRCHDLDLQRAHRRIAISPHRELRPDQARGTR
jgi:hypothetical protein